MADDVGAVRLGVCSSALVGTGRAEQFSNLRKAGHVVHIPREGRYLGDGNARVRAGKALGDVSLTFADSQPISM